MEKLKTLFKQDKKLIYAFWHGRLLMMPYVFLKQHHRTKPLAVLISLHRDGEYISRTAQHCDLQVIRGSSSRKGAQSIRKLLRFIQNGGEIALTPDGPRGPRYQVQPGIIQLAKLSGAWVVPITLGAVKKICFSSWDKFLIPWPFSKAVFICGEPLWIPPEAGAEDLETKRRELEQKLSRITAEADAYTKLPSNI